MVMDSYYVLGLDIGIGSCGWAILDMANHRIIDMGVRLWDPPQEPKTKISTASKRRSARSSRRNTQRTADRKKHCLRLLQTEGLIPEGETAQWLQSRAGEKPTLRLRVAGLDHILDDRSWAQVLYSICSHRGYIPHGEGGDDIEGKKVLKAIEHNESSMSQKGWRTVGELLAHEAHSRNRGGDYSNCVSNAQLVNEVELLFAAQSNLGNVHADNRFKDSFLKCMNWQKDVSDHDERVYKQVGFCTYFPTEKRAANACLSAEMCKAYERLGHTVVVYPDGSEVKLPPEVRKRAIQILFSPVKLPKNAECKVRYSDLKSWLDLDADAVFKNIDCDRENKEEPFKPVCWRSQRKKLPRDLLMRMRDNREFADAIDSALAYASSKESIEKQLDMLDLTEDEKAVIAELNYSSRAYSGYGSRSIKALALLIDAFEEDEVTTLAEAEDACGLQQLRLHGDKDLGTKLPPYELFDPTCNNPVVLRVMSQVRKVINAVSHEYGVPNEIHIELARELKHSQKEKDQIRKTNNETKEKRDILRKKLSEELHCEESSIPLKKLMKVELWEEQKGRDLYLDQSIAYERLIADDTYCEIDHILPYSRTCDDGRMNKILVLQKSNQEKKERTPYEWKHEVGDWDAFKLRVERLQHYPYKKKQRLLNMDLASNEPDFIQRNLNDTRYASRAAKNFIESYLAFPDGARKKHVTAVAGGATAALRNAWQIKKNREDDNLHHALDATVIAACDDSAVIAVARASENKALTPKDKRGELFNRTEPWEGFTDQAMVFKSSIIPTRMTDHKVSGRIFEDTLYHFEGLNQAGTKGMLSAKGSLKASSNYILNEQGTAQIVDGLAFLRLWWDSEATAGRRKAKPGVYIAEPVYFADLAKMVAGTYVPRMAPPQTDKRPRCNWEPLPERLLAQKPVVLFRNDALSINGVIRRFEGFNINNNSWLLADPTDAVSPEAATKGLPISSIEPDTRFQIINEDILGHCFKELEH